MRRKRRQEQTDRTTQEAEHLEGNSADHVRERNGEDDANEKQGRGQGRALGCVDILQDHIGDAANMVGSGAKRRRKNGRREDADAVGSEILQEPGHRRQDCRAPVFAVEQRAIAPILRGPSLGFGRGELDFSWILRFAHQESLGFALRLIDLPPARQPVGALHNIKAAKRDQHSRNDRAGVHPSPGAEFRQD